MNPCTLELENALVTVYQLYTLVKTLHAELKHNKIDEIIDLVEGAEYSGGKGSQKEEGYLTNFSSVFDPEAKDFAVNLYFSQMNKPAIMDILRKGKITFILERKTVDTYHRVGTPLLIEHWVGKGENITIDIGFFSEVQIGDQVGENCFVEKRTTPYTDVSIVCKVQ